MWQPRKWKFLPSVECTTAMLSLIEIVLGRSVDSKNVLIFLFGCIQLNNSLERTTWLDYQLYYTFLWNIPHNILCPNSDLTLANRSSIMIKFPPSYPIVLLCCPAFWKLFTQSSAHKALNMTKNSAKNLG